MNDPVGKMAKAPLALDRATRRPKALAFRGLYREGGGSEGLG